MTRLFKRRSRMVSHGALGLALAMGGAGLAVSAPASAAMVQEQMSNDFQKEIVAVQEAYKAAQENPGYANADEAGKAQMLRTATSALQIAKGKVKNAQDRLYYGQFAYNIGKDSGNAALENEGLTSMLESGQLEQSTAAEIAGVLGQNAMDADDYATARRYFQQSVELGSTEESIPVMIAETYFSAGDSAGGFSALDAQIAAARAAGTLPADLLYKRGMTVAYEEDNAAKALAYSSALARDYPNDTNYGDAIVIVREFADLDTDGMLDILRLMYRTNTYKQSFDLAEHIEAANPMRRPGEVVAIIDRGYENGIIERSDQAFATWRSEAAARVDEDRGSLAEAAADVRAGGNAGLAIGTGDGYLGYGMAAEAEEMYRAALTKPGVNTEVAMIRLGIALVDQGKYAEASEVFAKVEGARKAVADVWAAYAANAS